MSAQAAMLPEQEVSDVLPALSPWFPANTAVVRPGRYPNFSPVAPEALRIQWTFHEMVCLQSR